jgi:hypothetical protein
VSQPDNGNVQLVLKRKRTHRHRQNRLLRRLLAVAVLSVFVGTFSIFALRYFSPSIVGHTGPVVGAGLRSGVELDRTATLDQVLSNVRPSRPVYPYSVVPGGVEDVKELKWVAEHDPIVGAHYAGFNYARAQVVRLTLARTVYLSYRIGNHIYWTRRRITLHKGEKLITDGRMTARTRCANRVEESPQQQATSPSEPPAQKFDEPVRPGEGIAMSSPALPFESTFLSRPQLPGMEAVGPLNLYDPFVGGNLIPLSAPPVAAGLCAPVKGKGTAPTVTTNNKKNSLACQVVVTPEAVPEPGTWLLFISGLAFIGFQVRLKLLRA